MKKVLLAGAAALLLTGATADPSFAAMHGGGHAGAGAAHFSGGTGGRVGGSFNAAPRAAVTGGNFSRGATFNRGGSFNRGGTFAGRSGFAGRGTFAGRPGFAGRTTVWGGHRGYWGWRHGHRHFFPFGAVAAGVGVGLALGDTWGYNDDCLAWDGWRWVNTCVGPTVSWGWGGPGWGGPGWGGPGWW